MDQRLHVLIWQRIKSGDLDALGTLYDEYVETLSQYGNKLCRDKDFVNDCIHDLFLDLYKYRKNLSSTTSVEYYLLRSLKNRIFKKREAPMIALVPGDQTTAGRSDLVTSSAEEDLINREQREERTVRLASAMGLLTRQQRKGINLRFVEERTYPEIADTLNISVETARTLIYRGIKLLRQNKFGLWLAWLALSGA